MNYLETRCNNLVAATNVLRELIDKNHEQETTLLQHYFKLIRFNELVDEDSGSVWSVDTAGLVLLRSHYKPAPNYRVCGHAWGRAVQDVAECRAELKALETSFELVQALYSA